MSFLDKLDEFKNSTYKKIKNSIIKTTCYEIVLPFLIVLLIFFYGIVSGFLKFSDFIYLATLGALLWYSFETRQLKNATRTTNELQQLPFFVLIYDEQKLILKNEGKGMAYNIVIDPIKIDDKTFKFGEQWYYYKSGEKRDLSIAIDYINSTKYAIFKKSFEKFLYDIYNNVSDKKIKFNINFSSPLKNKNHQSIILKVPNDPVNIENIEFYNFDE